ncbi:hypothetical protein PACTADRAFT_34118 [Pachysolen tannophilus NRRL Y-2460]|uniref:Alpha-1,2-mannosyltransferase n=1 Tax=Pachysolen tannophilus NRRL Y-2460 TaxID=669874 RepID=A0A1E4TUU3_PACTA|nr:hypothetical protein PACTADRAFT_34118 [Pachysolen tannophilus NRRL Y-2460]
MGVTQSLYKNISERVYEFNKSSGNNGVPGIQLILLGIILSILSSSLTLKYLHKQKFKSSIKPLPAKLANNKERRWGHWKPEAFKAPIPKPYPDWDFKTTRPIPYRAFKHKYFVNMGIRSMDWNEWIELDNEWQKYHDLKLHRIATKNEQLYGTEPEARPAALELLNEFYQYLPNRYPKLFKQTTIGLDNLVTGESFNFFDHPLQEDPMLMIAKLIQDDIAVMVEAEDGNYYLKAGAIMLAGFWRLKDKLHLCLSDIHTSGDVPKYSTHLKAGMEKFFQRQTCDKPVVRNNYFIQTDNNLAWSDSIGDESNDSIGWYTAPKVKNIENCYFRSERQSVRRLPISGAMIFTVRTYFLPVEELCKEPFVPRRLFDGINSWDEDVKEYKGYEAFKDILMPYLEKKAKEQEAQGYTIENEKNCYPY